MGAGAAWGRGLMAGGHSVGRQREMGEDTPWGWEVTGGDVGGSSTELGGRGLADRVEAPSPGIGACLPFWHGLSLPWGLKSVQVSLYSVTNASALHPSPDRTPWPIPHKEPLAHSLAQPVPAPGAGARDKQPVANAICWLGAGPGLSSVPRAVQPRAVRRAGQTAPGSLSVRHGLPASQALGQPGRPATAGAS